MNSTGLNHTGPFIHGFLSINTCTVFNPWLGVHGHRGQTECIDVYTVDPWILVSSRGIQFLMDTKGQLKFGGSQKLHMDFQLCRNWGVGTPSHHIVQGSTVSYICISPIILLPDKLPKNEVMWQQGQGCSLQQDLWVRSWRQPRYPPQGSQ